MQTFVLTDYTVGYDGKIACLWLARIQQEAIGF